MTGFTTNLLSAFLLPPLNLLLIALAGFFIARWHPRLGRRLLALALALLWLCSTPLLADAGLRLLEAPFQAVDLRSQPADAIVVLGGGSDLNAPEYGADTVGEGTLARLRYAAKLQRASGKPILTSGGRPTSKGTAEATQMKVALEHDFNVPVRWTEDASGNTLQNARNSYQILHKEGIKRIYLVTHAWHMRRSVMAFQAAGFDVVPAATQFTHGAVDLFSFIPSAGGLYSSRIVMHELIGLWWYRLKS